MIVPNAPAYPTPSPSANLVGNMNNLANERAPSPDLLPRNAAKPPVILPPSVQVADYTGRFQLFQNNQKYLNTVTLRFE